MDASLTIVTWNVWFDHFEKRARGAALLSEALAQRPDVIALQEVTLPLLELIDEHPVLSTWWSSEPRLLGSRDYDVLMLSRRRPDAAGRLAMPTRMGRALVWARFPEITLGVVHLESLRSSGSFRQMQLQNIAEALGDSPRAAFMGDMNFAAGDPEEGILGDDWTDAWRASRPDEAGFTVDTQHNIMRQSSKDGRFHQARYDRIFLRSIDRCPLRPVSIERLGMTALPDDPLTFPSDHFGLVARLELAEEQGRDR